MIQLTCYKKFTLLVIKHGVTCGNFMPEIHFPANDVAYMEAWYQIEKIT
jgi:hypothetical protein